MLHISCTHEQLLQPRIIWFLWYFTCQSEDNLDKNYYLCIIRCLDLGEGVRSHNFWLNFLVCMGRQERAMSLTLHHSFSLVWILVWYHKFYSYFTLITIQNVQRNLQVNCQQDELCALELLNWFSAVGPFTAPWWKGQFYIVFSPPEQFFR